jgi:hypothetical protein
MPKKLLTCVWLLTFVATASGQEIVTLSTRSGVTQAYFLASLPKEPQAVAVLFPGSGGFIQIRQEQDKIKFENGNFLVRSRSEFIKHGVIAAIVDAPSDQQRGWGMTDEFRLGDQHFTDVSVLIGDLEKRFPNLPLFLVGTSRGTISAAALGARFAQRVAGVVLTSTMFREAGRKSNEPGPGLSRFDFSSIKIPVLFVHHVGDRCAVTPYGDAARFAARSPLITVWGGKSPQSGDCDAFSAHGYFGKEPETVEQIVNWMLKKPFREKVE